MDVGTSSQRATSSRSRAYFARYEGEDLAHELMAKVEAYERHVRESGLYGLLRKSYRMFYGMSEEGFSSKELGHKGEDDEYSVMVMNHYRNLGTHLANLMMQALPGLEPEPINSDFESERQAKFAKNLLTAYKKDEGLEDLEREALALAMFLGEMFVVPYWDPHAGEAVIPDGMLDPAPAPAAPGQGAPALPMGAEGAPEMVAPVNPPPPGADGGEEIPTVPPMLHEGDFRFWLVEPFDAIRDPRWKTPKDNPWRIYRRHENRHEVAAQYAGRMDEDGAPLSERILSTGRRRGLLDRDFMALEDVAGEDEQIEVFYFFHERTAALPAGKQAKFLSGGVMLEQDVLQYDHIPGRRYAAADIWRTPFGYSPLFDAMGPQDADNMLMSMILSNVRAFGYGTIAAPVGSNLQPDKVAAGLDLYEYPVHLTPDSIKTLDLCRIPQEVLVTQERVIGGAETVVGVNAVTRGVPQPSLKSGSALTFADSRSAEFAQGAQKRAVSFCAGIATDLITGLCKFAANRPRTRIIAGDYESSLMGPVTFQGEDLSRIRRVRATPVDLLSQTLSGKMQLLEMLMNHPDPRYHPTPAQVFSFIATGRWENVSKRDERQLANIRAFQSILAKGVLPGAAPDFGVLVTDNHQLWIGELLTVLDSPAVRADPSGRVKEVTLLVIQRHLDMWAAASIANPAILEMSGQAPLTT
ncbi:MAG TPA: hypothetical protein VFR62_04615, partial [Gemmatimonadales bacterium]|nr:hypothetical protein [Gemmatimonadales bacterium]